MICFDKYLTINFFEVPLILSSHVVDSVDVEVEEGCDEHNQIPSSRSHGHHWYDSENKDTDEIYASVQQVLHNQEWVSVSEPKLAFNDMFHLRKHTNDNVMVSPLASLFSFHFKDGENMTLQIMMMIQVTLLTMMFST